MTLTRDEYVNIVSHPGKFEGEPAWVPYFWDLTMDGGADDVDDDNGTDIYIFTIQEDDIAVFPELAGMSYVEVWETDQGFVCGLLY